MKLETLHEETLSEISLESFPSQAFTLMQRRPLRGLVEFIKTLTNNRLRPYVETLRLIPEVYRKQNPLNRYCPVIFFLGDKVSQAYTLGRISEMSDGHEHFKKTFDFNGVRYHLSSITPTFNGYEMCTFDSFVPFRPSRILAMFGDLSKAEIKI